MNTTFAFLEANFDQDAKIGWMAANWTMSFWFAAVYLLTIFTAHKIMRPRTSFRLQHPLFIWNLLLALFSLAGACRLLPEVSSSVQRFGFRYSVCDSSYFAGNTAIWAWLFALSKLPELVDTMFIILRKRPLYFLHWYHHMTVLCYCWYSYGGRISTGRWFMFINYASHAYMYSYYALKALRIRVPALMGVSVTALQLAEMAFGCFVTSLGYWLKAHGEQCDTSYRNLQVSLLMYMSYFALFAHFFYNTYVKRNGTQKMD